MLLTSQSCTLDTGFT